MGRRSNRISNTLSCPTWARPYLCSTSRNEYLTPPPAEEDEPVAVDPDPASFPADDDRLTSAFEPLLELAIGWDGVADDGLEMLAAEARAEDRAWRPTSLPERCWCAFTPRSWLPLGGR